MHPFFTLWKYQKTLRFSDAFRGKWQDALGTNGLNIYFSIFLGKLGSGGSEVFCARVPFFNKAAGLRPATLLKKKLWHRWFPVNFAKFLRTRIFIEYLWWLLLKTGIHRSSCSQVFYNTVILKISQNSPGKTCTGTSFSIKLQASSLLLYLKRDSWHGCFSGNFTKFLIPVLYNTFGWLLLKPRCTQHLV